MSIEQSKRERLTPTDAAAILEHAATLKYRELMSGLIFGAIDEAATVAQAAAAPTPRRKTAKR